MTVTNQDIKAQLREAIEVAQNEVESIRGFETRRPHSYAGDNDHTRAINNWHYLMDLLVDIEGAADALCEVVEND